MKRSSLFVLSVSAALLFGVSQSSAQFTISVPKLPKIKRDKPVVTTTETTTTTTTTATTPTSDASSTPAAASDDDGGWWVKYHIDEIAKLKKQFDEWDPANQYFPASITNDDYTGLALSKTQRAAWLKDHKTEPNARLDAAFESLKASIIKRLPDNKVEAKSFAYHNPAEEKMLVQQLSDVPGLKVYKAGFSESSWLIDKNDIGIPTARYKHGVVYGRDPNSEDPYCRLWAVNIIQDYSGGGTYAASSARYISKSYVACPAGM